MGRMSLLRARFLAICPFFLVACSAPSTEDLDVHGTVANAAFTLTTVNAPRLKGAFTLSLTLGQLASSASDATQMSFQLVESNGAAEPVPLPLSATATTSKHVSPGSTELIAYDYDSAASGGMQLLPAVSRLCSGTWAVNGSFFDSARGKTTPVAGPPIAVLCCTMAGQPGCP